MFTSQPTSNAAASQLESKKCISDKWFVFRWKSVTTFLGKLNQNRHELQVLLIETTSHFSSWRGSFVLNWEETRWLDLTWLEVIPPPPPPTLQEVSRIQIIVTRLAFGSKNDWQNETVLHYSLVPWTNYLSTKVCWENWFLMKPHFLFFWKPTNGSNPDFTIEN